MGKRDRDSVHGVFLKLSTVFALPVYYLGEGFKS